ncbi:DUF1254 domain-containing protein [Atopomonas sediminilitoris]|uniref:DUF1254 domain-containing protein n=1 Tax=Atopomonas sediminilitoris TaxID=2919919 RepID=UPI001F4D6DBE|nr:DUF1254 domain-containing protein [Atopomonas sediminilitoris]MCJ8169550.1 DUF1214 domain-containing protein [Atopomonas sediminilitoris]
MKSLIQAAWLSTLLVASSALAEPAKPDLNALATQVSIYGFPLVMNYKVFHDTFLDSSSPGYKGPLNQIHHTARTYTPDDTTVQTPNSDTPYSLLGTDLRSEPQVLCHADVPQDRYFSVQLVDMYTHNYAYIGSRSTGSQAGCFLLADSQWQGPTPAGIKQVLRSETAFNMVIFRTQLKSDADLPNVQKVQAGYQIQPLSSYLKQPAPAAAPTITWPAANKDIFTTGMPALLSFLQPFMPIALASPAEQQLREQMPLLGIGNPAALKDKAVQAAWGNGLKAAMGAINQAVAQLGSVHNGWQIGTAAGSRAFFNDNWLLRAVGSRAGIYGNDAIEATYPFTKHDLNGRPLDGSKHAYTLTFAPGQLPPAKAFWSITVYDANTQFLVKNPIKRYLVNSTMLDTLKRNADGSLTLFLQQQSPGKAHESNWLPAPNGPIFLVMRIYWPQEQSPSVLPLGQGDWQPPKIEAVTHLNTVGAKRPGDKAMETVIRTDERYGADPLFHGPRGVGYWRDLAYAAPIQNPNLWPDTQSTYFLSTLRMPAGSQLVFDGEYPYARYFKLALYRWQGNTFVSTGEDMAGDEIAPNPGSINPFVVGQPRLEPARSFRLKILAEDAPSDSRERQPNTLYAGAQGDKIQMVMRIYLPDNGKDGAGFGSAYGPQRGFGLPRYHGLLADGSKLSAAEVIQQFALPMNDALEQPVTPEQWQGLVNNPSNDPTLKPSTAPARQAPRWEKYWSFKYSIVGAFMSPSARQAIPYGGAMDGGGDPSTQYLLLHLSRQFGPVYVMRGKMPTFPDTYYGEAGQGLNQRPAAQTQYWSLVSCESAPSGQCVDGLTDMQVPLDAERNFTIVLSRAADRPKNATLDNGVAWLEWSPRGEGLTSASNREDFAMLMLRYMANAADWAESPEHIKKPGDEEKIMGAYYPRGQYMTTAEFEALTF